MSKKAARSASACARERDVCASATSRMMPASAVCSPVPVTSTRSEPAPLTVPAITASPSRFFTGRDSPVIIDSLTALSPSLTIAVRRDARARADQDEVAGPERGERHLLLPVAATTRTAVSGSSFASSFSAPCAWAIERISIQWPSSMTVTSVASSSQSGIPGYPSVTATLKTKATVMASEMSVIIPGSRLRSSRAAPWRKTRPP